MKKIVLLFMSITLLMTSCKDFLNMPPKNVKVVYTIEDVRTATSTLLFAITASSYGYIASKYVRFNNQYVQYPFTRATNVCSALYTNDLDLTNFISSESGRGGYSFRKEYYENNNWEGYIYSQNMWNQTFACVGFINMIIKDLENVPDYNKVDAERILGEVRVMRAYFLLRLNQLYAPLDNNDLGIPFNLDADIIAGGGRWKQTDLYKKLIGEIKDVLDYETLPKDSWNVFFNKRIMYAILAETYQFKASTCAAETDDWSNAEKYAKLARENNPVESTVAEQAELTTIPLSTVVNKPHKFALLRIALYASGPNDYSPWGEEEEVGVFQAPSDELYNMYDENDIRREVYFKKYDGKLKAVKLLSSGDHDINDTHVLFRYSELLLLEAEALERQGKPGALELLNQFKASKIPGYAGYKGSDIIGEILKERRKEFFLEEQINWIDMKRTKAAVSRQAKDDEGDKTVTYTLSGDDYRYTLPLPDSEMKYNTISQNPGWK